MADNKDCGALWVRTKEDKEYMTGTITIGDTVYEIVLFKNSYKKEGDRTPDWRIYHSKPRAEERVEPDTNDAGQFPAEGNDAIPF